jgi:hypothetical protein
MLTELAARLGLRPRSSVETVTAATPDATPVTAPDATPDATLDATPLTDDSSVCQATQVLLRLQYRQLRALGLPLPELADVEFRCYSQNGEDGILLYLFSLLGTTNRKVVEMCAGNGIECNAANLLVNHGWQGLLIDGDPQQIAGGLKFYARCRTTLYDPPTLLAAWVTAENVNALIRHRRFDGEIDLLSLDLDGVDYWIWRALDCIRPRVVVAEFNSLLGPEKRLTIPYHADFRADLSKPPHKVGASLSAFVHLGREKGYRLIGVQSMGFNAFFVRDGLGEDVLPEVSPHECFVRTERLRGWNEGWMDEMWKDGHEWQEV